MAPLLHNEALTDAKMLADAADKAMDEHLRPAFEAVEGLYMARLQDVAVKEPWAADKLRALALALKISQAARAQIEAKVKGGDLADDQLKRLRKIEAMSPERRRVLGL